MMDASTIAAILSQYKKHGWTLRRVLVSDSLRVQMGIAGSDIFDSAEIVYSDIDALWFSRSSRPGAETWELRRLGNSPYAIDAFLDEEMTVAARETIIMDTEERLRQNDSRHASDH